MVDCVELAAILDVGVGRQVHACVVEIDDEVVLCGGDPQPQCACAVAGKRQRGRALPAVLVLSDSVDAFLVFAPGGELAVEAGLDEDAVMVEGYDCVWPVGSDVVTCGDPEHNITVLYVYEFIIPRRGYYVFSCAVCPSVTIYPTDFVDTTSTLVGGRIETRLDSFESQDIEPWPRQGHVSIAPKMRLRLQS